MPLPADQISVNRIAKLHPAVAAETLQIASELWQADVRMRVTSGYRTWEEQTALYTIGRTTPGRIVTKAKAGQSYHNYGLAFDFCILNKQGRPTWNRADDFSGDFMPDWMQVVDAFKTRGWEWGGDWKSLKDYPHLQKTFGYKTTELMARTSNGLIRFPRLQ